MSRVLRFWLLTFLISTGAAALIVAGLVLPWTVETWTEKEFGLPALVVMANDCRIIVAFAIIALTGLRQYILNSIPLLIITIGGFFTWWIMYVEVLNAQMRM